MAKRSSTLGVSLANLQQEKQDYRAAQRSTRLRPKPRGIAPMGSSADYHLRKESDHLWIGELGQEFDRNNPVGKRLLDCMEDNVLQDVGFDYVPNTGDKGADTELKAWWNELSSDPHQIDLQGQHDFDQLTRFVLRADFAAGDIFGVFNEDGPIELREFHRCRQPSRTKGTSHANNVLGVEMNEKRQRVRYWFTKESIDPLDSAAVRHADLQPVPAFDESDEWRLPNVLHIYDPKRSTQTRGVSAFAPVFDPLGMHDDCQFQQMVRQHISNMLLIVRERGAGFNEEFLAQRQRAGVPAETGLVDRLVENLYPGSELPGFPGEKLMPWSPNIPNDSWFEHMKMVLRQIGVAWGLPYVLLMLDTSDSTFHGYRGALNEAQKLFRRIQWRMIGDWATPVVTHYLHRLADEDPAWGRRRDRTKSPRSKFNLFRHTWTRPGWSSVDPLKDATADSMRLANTLTTYTRLAASQDTDWPSMAEEGVKDKELLVMFAIEASERICTRLGYKSATPEQLIPWVEKLASMPTADRTQISLQMGESTAAPTGPPNE